MQIEFIFYIKCKNYLNINLKIKDKDIIIITGENGSGKTTILKNISGIIKPKFGYLEINKKIIQDTKKKKFLKTEKRKIGMLLQEPILFKNMNVIENINISENKKNKTIKFDKNYVLKKLNIEKIKYRNINNLSGGEKQRVCIAQIILMQPRMILLDEPFSFQDINMKKNIIEFINDINLNFNIPVIYATHDIDSILINAGKIIHIKNGKIVSRN